MKYIRLFENEDKDFLKRTNKCFSVSDKGYGTNVTYIGGISITPKKTNRMNWNKGMVVWNIFSFNYVDNDVHFSISDMSCIDIDEWESKTNYTPKEFISKYPYIVEKLYKKRRSFSRLHKLGKEMYSKLDEYISDLDTYLSSDKYNL